MSVLSFTIFIQTIVHLSRPPSPPPKKQTNKQTIYIIIVSSFSRVLQSSLEKSKTMVMQNYGGKTRCIMVYVKMVSKLANIKFCRKLGHNRPKMQFETTPFNPVPRSNSRWSVGAERVKQTNKQTNNLHNHCFQFLLGITIVPREIEGNGYAKLWGETRCIMVYVKMVSKLATIKFCRKLGHNRPKMQFETTPFNPVSRSNSVGAERVKKVQHNCQMLLCIKQLKG